MKVCQTAIVFFSIAWNAIGAASLLSASSSASSLPSTSTSTVSTIIGITGGATRNGSPNTNNSSLRAAASSSGPASARKTAVVVGGGPGGLAAALVLSNIKTPGDDTKGFFEKIIVLDDRAKESYDPTRSYVFNINKRGQTFTDAFGIDLAEDSSGVRDFRRHTVPADPSVVFDDSNPFGFTSTPENREKRGILYFITRDILIERIRDEINTRNKTKGNDHAIIELRRGVGCEFIEPTEDGLVKVVMAGTNHEDIVVDFCVGADGVSSRVRQSLEDGRFDPSHWENAKNPSRKFRLIKYASPATGLRTKGLRLQPNFAIPKGGPDGVNDATTKLPLDNLCVYGLASATTGPTNSLPLTLFPQKNPQSIRPLQICTMPDHDVWNPSKIKTDDGGRSVKAFFQKAHPRFDWNKIVDDKEWELFAAAKGTTFPHCQYAPSMYVSSKMNSVGGDDGGAGVAIIGDALHAFPPDNGQGVNIAFCDAMALGKSFEDAAVAQTAPTTKTPTAKTETETFVSRALKSYQKRNGPETRAIVQLSRFGAPFQYYQPSLIMRFRKKLWFTNFLGRALLNKITNGLSPNQCARMAQVRRLFAYLRACLFVCLISTSALCGFWFCSEIR